MYNVLILLTFPEEIATRYLDHLQTAFPQLNIDLVDHYSKTGPYLQTADILLTFPSMISEEVLQNGGNLKWVQALSTGLDGIVDRPALRPDVVLTNMWGIHGPPVSEAALAAMLALTRDLPRAVRNQQQRIWHRFMPSLMNRKTAGIFGIGVIAEELATKCQAFGMKVIGFTSTPRDVAGFDEVLTRADILHTAGDLDYLILLVPYSEETRGIIGAEVFAAMKATGYLINVARGGVVDEPALIAALEAGEIAGAALDVFTEEPLPESSPFWEMNNVLITPKQGGYCDVYSDYALPIVEENMRHFLAGDIDSMINIVPH